ncbi:phenylalanine--tRNA ligase beta subunit [Agaricicola taiwanensis]|uniref:Phenylalanine--tRNA ligase beta subunit n=1 Tax=Agaricicola taiwanensis TaxID=591372 RepID=A0A8J2VN03_9RHOB|nr:phenylalanine--tRNA ligase subunit beta [Agaricicola taiwanensis]GGE29837.1 phenylalanine--tRNA ligase beta subunit [Agaricicola taiwanensis]
MKFTLSWLKEHLATDAGLEKVADTLTHVGLEVEAIEDRGAQLAPFKVVHVIEAKPHPNADKLRVCRVDTGAGEVQVVCGAPNARTGMKAVFAPSGSTIPANGMVLKPTRIRDVESNGMLVSEREMGLSGEHDGIIEMPADAPVGQPFAPLMGVADPVIEIAVTPNRPDCLGVEGVARDLAAAEIGTLKTAPVNPVRGQFPCPTRVRRELPAGEEALCPAFALRLVRGVKNGPSPAWLQSRLKAIGLRPINCLVDITNFLTYDRARPLHVFDAAKISGDLVVRLAREGESLPALDGKIYELPADAVVIADETGVQSLAGIMGGEGSGCTEETVDVLIESALWDPENIARTGRRLGVHSDARHRFERGVDPAFTLPGLEAATKLILDLCGGEASEVVLEGEVPEPQKIIDFPYREVQRLTGLELQPVEMKHVLTALGFWVAGTGETVKVAAPTWRPDIHGKADIVEEVVRIVGLDKVTPIALPRAPEVPQPVLTLIQRRTRAAKRALAARGLVEAVTWSFVPKGHATAFGGGAAELALANPIAADLSDMRPSLLPGLAVAAQKNADRGYPDVALFEVGQVFSGDKPEDQFIAATGLRRGLATPEGTGRHWSGKPEPVDAFDAKADALALLTALGIDPSKVQVVSGGPEWFHPGRSGTLQMGPKLALGHFGELHPRVLQELDISGPLAAFEVILDRLPAPRSKPTKAKPPLDKSDFQPISRDFAFLVDRNVKAGDLIRAAQGADKQFITGVDVFDVYTGTGVPDGKASVALAVTLQPREKTLTDAEIEAIAGRVVSAVEKATGGTLRG